jgi:hypothetical protein
MSTSPLSSQEIRAAAEVHQELDPEYHDAVVESFLAKVEKEIEARVDARLAASRPAPSRQLDAATLAKAAAGTEAHGARLGWRSDSAEHLQPVGVSA